MQNVAALLVAVLCACAVVACRAQLTRTEVFCVGGVEAPTVAPTDLYDIYFIEAPLSEWQYGDTFKYIKGFHAALGFMGVNNNKSFTVEYDAYTSVGGATIPQLVHNNVTNTTELVWHNVAAICIFPFINISYWDHSFTRIGAINGSALNTFMAWTVADNQTNPIYDLFRASASHDAVPYLDSSNCVDFEWRALTKLYEWGVYLRMDIIAGLRHDNIYLYMENPQPVDLNAEKAEIIQFYSLFGGYTGVWDFVEKMASLLVEKKYLYHRNNYYRVTMRFPYFGYHYETEPVPSPRFK
jgi:hypothetical protein